MKEIHIKVSNISSKQWPLLLVELNLVAQNWKRYGVKATLKAPSLKKIITLGTTHVETTKKIRRSGK